MHDGFAHLPESLLVLIYGHSYLLNLYLQRSNIIDIDTICFCFK